MGKKVTNIEVKDTTVRTIKNEGEDFVCITDIARLKNGDDPNGLIANWMRNRNTIEFLGIWEQLFNPNFNPSNSRGLGKRQASMHSHCLLQSGLKQQMQKVLSHWQDVMEALTPVQTLPLNSHHGFL